MREDAEMAWRAGDKAPTDLYRTADGRVVEAVVLDEEHEVIVEAGDKLDADQAAIGRQMQAEAEARAAAVTTAETVESAEEG